MVTLVLAALVAAAASEAANPLVTVWLPTFGAIAALAAIIIAAMRRPGEDSSRLYGDAMKMVAELKEQVATEKAQREHMELRLVEAQADRYELERKVIQLYGRIEELERLVGGRREDDAPHHP